MVNNVYCACAITKQYMLLMKKKLKNTLLTVVKNGVQIPVLQLQVTIIIRCSSINFCEFRCIANHKNFACRIRIKQLAQEINLTEDVIGAERALLDFPVSRNVRTVGEFNVGDSFSIRSVIADRIIRGCMLFFVMMILISVAALAVRGVAGG